MKRRKKRLLPKIVIAGLAVYFAINLLHLQMDINEAQREVEDLRVKVERQKRENARLKEISEVSLDEELIAQAARSELGLVSPGERIFVDISN
ncbi:MAG: FtsB family cell division protein [Eubacteriales bacterium]|jgi:cell division protein FtsL